MIVNITTNG